MTRPDPPREPQINPPGTLVRAGAVFLSGCGVVLLIGGILMWFNHAFPTCTNEILSVTPSPDGKFKAVMFRRSCAAADEVSINVSIFGTSETPPNEAGNSFIARGVTPPTVRWIDNRKLLVDDLTADHVILRVTKYGEIQISDH